MPLGVLTLFATWARRMGFLLLLRTLGTFAAGAGRMGFVVPLDTLVLFAVWASPISCCFFVFTFSSGGMLAFPSNSGRMEPATRDFGILLMRGGVSGSMGLCSHSLSARMVAFTSALGGMQPAHLGLSHSLPARMWPPHPL